MKLKRILWILVCALLILSLVACNKSDVMSPADTSDNKTAAVVEENRKQDPESQEAKEQPKEQEKPEKVNSNLVFPEEVADLKHDVSYRNGLLLAFNKEGKGGYINKEGEIVIPFIYDTARGFYSKYTVVSINNKYGVIDTLGNAILPLEYDFIYNTYSGNAADTLVVFDLCKFIVRKEIYVENYESSIEAPGMQEWPMP